MKRPLILIPASFNADQPPAKYHFNVAYTTRIVSAGGFPIGVMRPDEDDIDEILKDTDGLFLMGGNDVDPAEYNEADHSCVFCEPARDKVELMLIKKAVALRMPIFAICRGLQMMNVAMGGTLYQDVEKQMEGALRHSNHKDENGTILPRDMIAHNVATTEGTLFHSLAKSSELRVNSLHHQGIKKLADGLRVGATAPDGLIEAVEIENYPFSIGVQWHPEELHDDVSESLFFAFIDASKKYHETKNRQ
jgi:putative glutamine amidotransferase